MVYISEKKYMSTHTGFVEYADTLPSIFKRYRMESHIDSRLKLNYNSDTLFIYENALSCYIWNSYNGFMIFPQREYNDNVICDKQVVERHNYLIKSISPGQYRTSMFRTIKSWNLELMHHLTINKGSCDFDVASHFLCRVIIKRSQVKNVSCISIVPNADWEEAERRYYGKSDSNSITTDKGKDVDIEAINRRALGLPDNLQTSEKDNKDPKNDNFSKWPFIVIAIITTLIAASLIIYRKRKK
ncbi:MAG: hypothetical protein IJU62_09780 [Muribaculaceae bacterium]|nr:hypothetical protein [Muribaculaceae bacterium]